MTDTAWIVSSVLIEDAKYHIPNRSSWILSQGVLEHSDGKILLYLGNAIVQH